MKFLTILLMALAVLPDLAQASRRPGIMTMPIRQLDVTVRIKKTWLVPSPTGDEIVCEFKGKVGLLDRRLDPEAGTFTPLLKRCQSYVGKKLKKNSVDVDITVDPSLITDADGTELKRIQFKTIVALNRWPGNFFILNVLNETADLNLANLRARTTIGLQGSDMPKNNEYWIMEAKVEDPGQ